MNIEAAEGPDLYRVFAFLLGHPSADRFVMLTRPGPESVLETLRRSLKSSGRRPGPAKFEDFEHYEAAYIALFDVGCPAPPVPLLESDYHNAVPAQKTVLENSDFYQVLGLCPSASGAAPDHLVTQLEFLAAVRYLQENCKAESERAGLCRLEYDFLERHVLSWLPEVLCRLEELNPPIFPYLFSALLHFLRRRHRDVLSLASSKR